MPFRTTRPRPSQHLTEAAILAGALLLGATPAFREAWRALVEGSPEWVLVVLVPMGGHHLIFWAAGLLGLHVDRTDRPAWVAKHRIQSGRPQRPPFSRVWRVLAVNQLFWSPLLMVATWQFLKLRGWSVSPELPSLPRLLGEVAAMSALSVTWFYASHRFLHRPWWMHRVHRVHHEFRTTTVIASEYAHWLEFVVANFGTLACGIWLLAPTLPSIYLFSLLAFATFLAHHSGYALPWVSSPLHHDWHHYRYNEAFGTLGHLDRLFGTSREFSGLKDGQVVP